MSLTHHILTLAALTDLPSDLYDSAHDTLTGLSTQVKGAAGAILVVAILWVLMNGDGEDERG